MFTGPAPTVGVVEAGQIRAYLVATNGRQATIGYRRAGDLVANRALSLTRAIRMNLEAVEPCSLTTLDARTLYQEMRRNPTVARAVAAEAVRLLEETFGALAIAVFGGAKAQVARQLTDRAQYDPSVGCLVVQMTQTELALAAGTAREVAARILGDLRREGIVSTGKGRVNVLDEARLAGLVGIWLARNETGAQAIVSVDSVWDRAWSGDERSSSWLLSGATHASPKFVLRLARGGVVPQQETRPSEPSGELPSEGQSQRVHVYCLGILPFPCDSAARAGVGAS